MAVGLAASGPDGPTPIIPPEADPGSILGGNQGDQLDEGERGLGLGGRSTSGRHSAGGAGAFSLDPPACGGDPGAVLRFLRLAVLSSSLRSC